MADMPGNNPQGGTPAHAKQTIKLKPLSFKAPAGGANPMAQTVKLTPGAPAQPHGSAPVLTGTATRGIPLMKPMGATSHIQPGATATRGIPLMKPVPGAHPQPGATATRGIPLMKPVPGAHPQPGVTATRGIPLMKPVPGVHIQPGATATRGIPLSQIKKVAAPGSNTASRPIPTAVGTASRPIPTAVGTASRPIPVEGGLRPAAVTAPDPVATPTRAVPLMKPGSAVPDNGEVDREFEQTQTVRLHRPSPHRLPPREAKVTPGVVPGGTTVRLSTGATAAPGAKTVTLQTPKISTSTVGIDMKPLQPAVTKDETLELQNTAQQTGTVGIETQTAAIGTETDIVGLQKPPVTVGGGKTPTLKLKPLKPPLASRETVVLSTPGIAPQILADGTPQTAPSTQAIPASTQGIPVMTQSIPAMDPAVSTSTQTLSDGTQAVPQIATPVQETIHLQEVPQVEAPQVEAPQVEAPQVEAPQVEAPQVEAEQQIIAESPEAETPAAEEAVQETPAEAEDEKKNEPGIVFTIISTLAALALLAILIFAAVQYCNHWEGTSIQIPGLTTLSVRK